MSYQYGPELVMVYANEVFYASLQGVLANQLNQNNTSCYLYEFWLTFSP